MLYIIQIISFSIGFVYGIWSVEYWINNIREPNFDYSLPMYIIRETPFMFLAFVVSPIHWLIVKVRPRFIQWCRTYNK